MAFTKERYMAEVEGKFISRREHPLYNNIVILNYTENATYEKRWNDITLNCRGLILNEDTGEVLAMPFPKFFNYGELPEMEVDIPFDEIPEFTIKQDGSLGISYKIDNKIYWATRGSFESEQAKAAQKIWEEKYSHVEIPDELTLLVEIIDPTSRVVVNYNNISDLIIIGAINRFTGYDFNYKELNELALELNMKVTPMAQLTLDQALKLKETLEYNSEGWVLRWPNGKRLKIKGNQYLAIHKIAYGLSDKMKVEYWMNGKIDELILKMPEEFRDEIECFHQTLNVKLTQLTCDVLKEIENCKNNSTDRKSFAIFVRKYAKKEIQYLIFKGYDNKLDTALLKEHIYKNYLDFI